MSQRSKLSPVLIAAVVIPVLVGAVLLTGFPVTHSQGSSCPYCGASSDTTTLLGVRVSERVTPSILTAYWIKNVEPNHSHTWVPICGNDNFGFGRHTDCPGGSRERWRLQDEAVVSILNTLPSAGARKQFMDDLWSIGPDMPSEEHDRKRAAVYELRAAYQENPERTDWPEMIKKLGIHYDEH